MQYSVIVLKALQNQLRQWRYIRDVVQYWHKKKTSVIKFLPDFYLGPNYIKYKNIIRQPVFVYLTLTFLTIAAKTQP